MFFFVFCFKDSLFTVKLKINFVFLHIDTFVN